MAENNSTGNNGNVGPERQDEPVPVARGEAEIKPSKCECEQKPYFSKKKKDLISLFTLIAISVYTGITILLWCNSNRQIAVSRDTEQRQLRAYVFVDTAQTVNIDDDITKDDTTALQSVIITTKNYGLTPAFGVKDDGTLKFTDFPPKSDVFHKLQPTGPISVETMGPQGMSKKVIEPVPNFALGVPRKKLLKDKVKAIYVFGKIDYRDAFGFHRCTRYRYMVGGDAGFQPDGTLLKMEVGNEADIDCQKPD
jgi:hypothetical protein